MSVVASASSIEPTFISHPDALPAVNDFFTHTTLNCIRPLVGVSPQDCLYVNPVLVSFGVSIYAVTL